MTILLASVNLPCLVVGTKCSGRSNPMPTVLRAIAALLRSLLRSRHSMQLEILALRHQLAVYQRTSKRPPLRPSDRLLWVWLSRAWPRWREALLIVQPRTVVAWRRRRFREHWTRLCRSGRPGRPAVAREVRVLIRRMSRSNPGPVLAKPPSVPRDHGPWLNDQQSLSPAGPGSR